MKKYTISITIENEKGDCFTQIQAGGLPVEGKNGQIELDAHSQEEMLYKIYTNVLAVFCKAIGGNLSENLNKYKKLRDAEGERFNIEEFK